jgi:hypothetical protein
MSIVRTVTRTRNLTVINSILRTQIRRTVTQYLIERCLIEQEQGGTGELGQETSVWVSVAADLPCRVISATRSTNTSAIDQAGAQETLREDYRLIVPAGSALDVNQRVTVNGAVYQVIRVETALTDEVYRSAVMVRRRGER